MADRPEGPDDSPGFLLWHATLRWQRATVAALAPLGLTHVQFVLLASAWWIAAHGGPPSQRELADHAGTDPMMTSQVVRTLERNGLLERATDPADARVRRLTVTPQGAALARQAIDVVESVDARFFAPVGDPAAVLRVLTVLGGRDAG